jgi:hypothetical protein
MIRLNNEICEMSSDQLDQVSGGENRQLSPVQKLAQDDYARIRVLAAVQGEQNHVVSEFRQLRLWW